jgi:alpha-beta hydrolase superfamily lysophospholipase
MKSLRHAAQFAVPLLLTLGAAAAFLVLAVARRVVTPIRRRPDTEIIAVDTGAQTIELGRTLDTEMPGRYGLFTTGTYGYVKLGAVLSADSTSVRRKLLTKIDAGARVDRDASFSGTYYTSPSELHLRWENVLIGSSAGPCPAWFFPASSSTWVIQVHGRGATRAECLRAVPVLHAAGLPTLVVSYRNDGEAPRTRAGAYALGAAEWRDVDAAIAYALRHGADRVVLMGWSMGGAIALQTAVSSGNHDRIAGVILESPVVDWRTVLRFQAKVAGVRAPLPDLAMRALQTPLTARLSGADQPIVFDRLDMVARAEELTAPMLILHSDDDGFVPADASHALRDARPDLVTMPRFAVARHTKLWNYDEKGWTSAISEWIAAQGLSASA